MLSSSPMEITRFLRIPSWMTGPVAVWLLPAPSLKVTLTGPAGAGGISVGLSTQVPALTLPASVTVPQGALSAAFTIKTAPVAEDVAAAVVASLNDATASGTLTVKAPVLRTFSVSPASVKGGATVTGLITISSAAPAVGSVSCSSRQLKTLALPMQKNRGGGLTLPPQSARPLSKKCR